MDRISNLLTSAIGDGNSKDHAIVASRGLASRADRCQRRSGQQFQLANRLHSDPLAMDLRVIDQRSHFGFDGGQDAADLFRWPLEILGGENPKRDGGNGELAAPIEYLIELARSEAVNRMRIGEAESLPIPSVAVEDDADMRRHLTAAYLPKQSAFVEVIDDFLHLSA